MGRGNGCELPVHVVGTGLLELLPCKFFLSVFAVEFKTVWSGWAVAVTKD